MAELVDALDSGSSGRKPVEVRVLSGALVGIVNFECLMLNLPRLVEPGRSLQNSTLQFVAQVLKLVDRPD